MDGGGVYNPHEFGNTASTTPHHGPPCSSYSYTYTATTTTTTTTAPMEGDSEIGMETGAAMETDDGTIVTVQTDGCTRSHNNNTDSPTTIGSIASDRAVAPSKRSSGSSSGSGISLRNCKKSRGMKKQEEELMHFSSSHKHSMTKEEEEEDEVPTSSSHHREEGLLLLEEEEHDKSLSFPASSSLSLGEETGMDECGDNNCNNSDNCKHDINSSRNGANNVNNISNSDDKNKNATNEWSDMVKQLRELLQMQTANNQNRIEDFLDGVEARRTATTELEHIVQDCQGVLEQTLQTLLQQVVVQIHAHCQDVLGDLEPNIVMSLTKNHKKRTKLLQRIEQAQQVYMHRNDNLMARVDNPSHNHNNNHPANNNHQDEGVGVGGGVPTSPSPNSPDSTATAAAASSSPPQEQEDPDWDTLVAEHEPNRDKIRLFLEGRNRKLQADETLDAILQDVHVTLKEQVLDATIQSAIRIHERSEQELQELEQDIQQYIFSNHHRRQAFKKSLEESTERVQGFFTDTLARVRAGLGNLGGGGQQQQQPHDQGGPTLSVGTAATTTTAGSADK